GNPQMDLQEKGVIDSGCSRHMTGNMSYLTDYEEINRGYVAFGEKQKPRKPKRQDTEETQPSGPISNVEDEAFNEENVSKHSNDPLHSGKDRIQLKELMEIYTNLQNRVFDMENINTDQA
nr:ribonuclease H-like domain-containing protein [Tanacetum cinerariifolium]